jgi:hypothetical protein
MVTVSGDPLLDDVCRDTGPAEVGGTLEREDRVAGQGFWRAAGSVPEAGVTPIAVAARACPQIPGPVNLHHVCRVRMMRRDLSQSGTNQNGADMISEAPPLPAKPQAASRPVLIYLAILATVFTVGSLTLGVVAYIGSQHAAQRIERLQTISNQLQRDTNQNLCSQQAYGIGATCAGD